MELVKKSVAKVKNNTIGAIAGAGLTYYGLKKSGKVSKTWMLIGLSILGGYVGAYAQSMASAAGSAPAGK